MKHIFIVNPAAGVGQSEKIQLPKIIRFLKESGIEYEIHRTLNKAEVGSWIRQRVEVGDPIRFYAIGGDGTICDVINGCACHNNVEVAVIPCGSGNDFVKNFTNVKNFLSLEKQVAGKAVPIDAIRYNDNFCINMLNIGADCDVVVKSDELRQAGKSQGAVSYIAAALDILPKGPKYKLAYTLNGTEYEEDLMLVAVANGKFCGGGFKACPTAKLNDGLMDVSIVKPCTGLTLMKMLVKYRMGTHLQDREADKYVKYLQLTEFDLKPVDDCVVSVDGEVFDFVPTHFEIVKNAVNFVIPEGSEFIG